MKNILILFSLLILGGCYEMDTQPFDKVSAGSFWKTEEHALQGIMGVYADMKDPYLFGLYNMFDNVTDIAIGYDGQGLGNIIDGNFTDRTSIVVNRWRRGYDGIQRANTVIRNVSEMEISEEVKSTVIGEAKFLRAYFYFYLLNLFGGVPLYDESVDLNKDFNQLKAPRSTEEEVRAFIIADLDDAINNLPTSYPQEHYGRATKGAATALRGKVYLFNSEWEKAIEDLEDVVYNTTNNYGYSLHDSYPELFTPVADSSDEMIFAIQNKGGVGFAYGMRLAFYLGTRSTFGSCWNNGMPSTTLADMYENLDGSPFSWEEHFPGFDSDNSVKESVFLASHNAGVFTSLPDTAKLGEIYRNRDPRLMQSLVVPYSWQLGWNANQPRNMQLVIATGVNENFGQIRNNRGWQTYVWRKFVPEGNMNGDLTNRAHTPINFPMIRLADVILMLAEAYNETNASNKAITEINKIRERSGMPGLNSGHPSLNVSGTDEVRERIIHERAVELAGEGHRYFDLKRWGLLAQYSDGVIEQGVTGSNLFTRGYQDRHQIWPIPAQEIEINPSLSQNPGWE
ncbi:RagB/SusD family nutrient uptake outer membrane protein [Cyclobacterium sp. 1_MG-2023]|uniref:RagB/SusD family nutrient uptake outer membrane protein n=1 Tax=Cyclobacterium sp. 1_MG-2023 TaxID=3062681 RepID=UPI0026E1D08F|nr:RagB/SusD family nutrient uptake outer membrane protein [Cyclobacterium sp. 1_MG-2023]MDO6437804.1 RagB/SusD family nutrient uptake outer membrane protein [Cyclobacterium sp. 1_MG-2023]